MLTKLEPADQKKVLHIVNCRGNDSFEAVSVCFAVRLELLTYLLTFVERSFGLNIKLDLYNYTDLAVLSTLHCHE